MRYGCCLGNGGKQIVEAGQRAAEMIEMTQVDHKLFISCSFDAKSHSCGCTSVCMGNCRAGEQLGGRGRGVYLSVWVITSYYTFIVLFPGLF